MKNTSFIKTILIVIIAIAVFTAIPFSASAIDLKYENGDLKFVAQSAKATTNIKFKTIGFTASFTGMSGTHYTTKVKMEQKSEVDLGDGTLRTTFVIPFVGSGNTIMKRFIDTYGKKNDFVTFFQNDNTIHLDAIMTIIENGIAKGSLDYNGTATGEVYTTLNGITNARDWSTGADNSFPQYFDLERFFPGQVVPDEDKPDLPIPTPEPTPTPGAQPTPTPMPKPTPTPLATPTPEPYVIQPKTHYHLIYAQSNTPRALTAGRPFDVTGQAPMYPFNQTSTKPATVKDPFMDSAQYILDTNKVVPVLNVSRKNDKTLSVNVSGSYVKLGATNLEIGRKGVNYLIFAEIFNDLNFTTGYFDKWHIDPWMDKMNGEFFSGAVETSIFDGLGGWSYARGYGEFEIPYPWDDLMQIGSGAYDPNAEPEDKAPAKNYLNYNRIVKFDLIETESYISSYYLTLVVYSPDGKYNVVSTRITR